MRRRANHGEHVRLGDELDRNGNAVFPCTEGLIVRSGDEAAVLKAVSTLEKIKQAETYLIAERDGVDRTKMMIVFLHHVSTSGVVLQNLLIGHAGQEFVRRARVDAHHMWSLSAGEFVQALSSLRIPKLHVPVVTS